MESLHAKITAARRFVEDDALPWLEKLNALGQLSIGWPKKGLKKSRERSGAIESDSHLPDSFVWFPHGQPTASSTSIVSSRLGRKVDSLDRIFHVLRSALAQLDPQRQIVLSVDGTTTHEFVARGCELFGVPLLHVSTPAPNTSLKNWAIASLRSVEEHPDQSVCFISNPTQTADCEPPLRDQVEVLASDQLLVLNLRRAGNLDRLVSKRLNGETARVYLAIGHDQLVPKEISKELMDAGAIGWLLVGNERSTGQCPMDTAAAQPTASIFPLHSLSNQERYLTHCTRRARGAWPDQDKTDYLDQLILGEPARDRSSFAALMRIVRMQRLLASGDSIRDATPVVSLTAARLEELASMRTFRAHRGRWDFEPYGVALDRELLVTQGVREVIYGDDPVWNNLSKENRPYFQKLRSDSGIDWSVEKEWRVVGDIDLSAIPSGKAFVFVPTRIEAKHLASVSRWPVVVVD